MVISLVVNILKKRYKTAYYSHFYQIGLTMKAGRKLVRSGRMSAPLPPISAFWKNISPPPLTRRLKKNWKPLLPAVLKRAAHRPIFNPQLPIKKEESYYAGSGQSCCYRGRRCWRVCFISPDQTWLDRCDAAGTLDLTSGSTWHAAGGMHTINGDPNVAKLQQYTISLYKEIEELSGQDIGLHMTGGVSCWRQHKNALTG